MIRSARGVACAVVAAACASPTVAAPPAPAMPLTLKLQASPTRLRMAERGKFTVGLEVSNHGAAAINPRLTTDCHLTVNGEESMAWNLAIGNGTREPSWESLPPGKTVRIAWPLGEDLFEHPGDYHLVLSLGAQRASAEIHVAP